MQYKLEDLASNFDYGLNAAAKNYDGINKYLRITDIDEDTRIFKTNDIKSPSGKLEGKNSYLLSQNDIVFARTGASVGKTYLYNCSDGKVYFAGYLIRIRVNNFNSPEFIFYNTLTAKYQNFVQITSVRSGQPGINSEEYKKYKINIPNLDEQKLIGNLLIRLDEIIALEQEWCKSINLKKQFLIRNLFPNDDLKPHLRFEGYNTNWKVKKIKEIAEIHNKLRIPIKESLRVPGKTPYYGANGIQGYVSGYTHKGEFTLIAEDGANDIINYPTIFVSGEIWVNNHAHVLTGKADILDTEFLAYYIQSMNIAKYLVGSGRWKLNAGILAEIPIILPQLEEQIKIRNILKSIDKLIIKSKNKIESYKNLKEILLKEMFI